MTHPSGARFLVLHALRLKGFCEADAVTTSTGVPADEAAGLLPDLAAAGLVHRRDGKVSGWSLTGPGREEHRRLVADELATAGCAGAVESAYRDFLGVNGTFLAVATAWQLRADGPAPAVNDHTDPEYDAAVVARLAAVHDEVVPVTAELGTHLARFAPYRRRLTHAYERVRAGEAEWLTRPLVDSYHTVWFELHEDLLATLGRERASEQEQAAVQEVQAG